MATQSGSSRRRGHRRGHGLPPARGRYVSHIDDGVHSIPLSERKSSSSAVRRGLAALEVQPAATGQQLRLVVGEQEDVRVDGLGRVEPEGEDAQRHPRLVRGNRQHDRCAVAARLSELLRTGRVEPRRHEDRAARRVEIEHLGRVGSQEVAVLERPPADFVAASPKDRDVEGVDLRLEQHLRFSRRVVRGGREQALGRGRRYLERESLECPVTAALDRGRDVGQRHDRADLGPLSDELERRHIPLDPVVVGRERRGAHELDRAVLADQTSACSRRPCRRDQSRDRDRNPRTQPSDHLPPPSLECGYVRGWTARCGGVVPAAGHFPAMRARVSQKWLRRRDACSNPAEGARRAHAARPSTRATLRTACSPQHRPLLRRSTGVWR